MTLERERTKYQLQNKGVQKKKAAIHRVVHDAGHPFPKDAQGAAWPLRSISCPPPVLTLELVLRSRFSLRLHPFFLSSSGRPRTRGGVEVDDRAGRAPGRAPPGARASQSQTSQKLTFLTIEPPNRHDAPPTRITQSASNFLHGRAAARARRILSRSAAHSSIYGAVSHRLTTRILFGRALAHAVYSAAWGGAVSHRLTSLVGRALARTPYTLPHAVAPSLTTRFDRGSEPMSHAHPRSRPWPQAHVARLASIL